MSDSSMGGSRDGGSGDGGFSIPRDAMVDSAVAEECLGGDGELIIDMQTHFTTPDPDTSAVVAGFFPSINTTNFPWLVRRAEDKHQTNRDAYIELIMEGSDTTVGVLSGIAYGATPESTQIGAGFMAAPREVF